MTISAVVWIISYFVACWIVYPMLLTTLKYLLYIKNELTLEFEIGLDQLMSYWKIAPFLLPYILFTFLASAIKDLFK